MHADAEDEHRLAGDVPDVLHPRQPGLEQGEAPLHEHHEDRGDDDPDGAYRNSELVVGHPTSTSSSLRPVLL